MSFTTDWLALREPADKVARNRLLIAELMAHLNGRVPRITELGCGTGSSLRALSPYLPAGTEWLLVDGDPALLQAARGLAEGTPGLRFMQADLGAGLEAVLAEPADLVTASAFIDLCSHAWLDRLSLAMPKGAALYITLSYDGHETWWPQHPVERMALTAFHVHMRQEKGLGPGPALGPEAAETLALMLSVRGWRVRTAPSPWHLRATEDQALIEALADGAAAALAETQVLDEETLGAWHAARRAAERVDIGHLDLLAIPPD
jgi:SAM-dependent methyltransferase